MSLAPLINVSYVKNLTRQLAIKNRKMHFCQSFWVSKFLTGRENGSQKALLDGNLALKIAHRTGIWLSKLLTGREFGSQNCLPGRNLALKGITGRELDSQNYLPDENLAMT